MNSCFFLILALGKDGIERANLQTLHELRVNVLGFTQGCVGGIRESTDFIKRVGLEAGG